MATVRFTLPHGCSPVGLLHLCWICPLCCDGIGDEMHYLTQCQISIISRTRVELLEPFHKKWKGIHKLTQIELPNAILACQNDDMLSETGLLCLKIQKAFEKKAL